MRGALISTAFVATVAAQGVTSIIPPPGTAPSQCQASADGRWELSVEPLEPEKSLAPVAPVSAVPVAGMPGMPAPSPSGVPMAPLAPIQPSPSNTPMPMKKRAEPIKNTLLVTLNNGVLKDRYNRVGYIAANRQFQFDGPPQAGALFTGGFSLCSNGTIALGPSAVFYRCQSGDFYNLYDKKWATHCNGIFIHATKARDEVVSEVPPLPSTAPPVVLPVPSAGTTPAVIVPPASTTITTNSSALSTASSLSSVASSAASVASSASSSATRAAAGATVPTAPGAPVVPSAASDGDRNQISAIVGLSMAFVFAALLL